MTSFNPEYIQTGDGNLSEPVHVGRPGQQVIFSNTTPAESYAAKYPTIESVPANFNGTVDIVTPTYRATVKGDGTNKYTTGFSNSIIDRPSASIVGKGEWFSEGALRQSDGIKWTNEMVDSTFKGFYVDTSASPLIDVYFRYPWSATLDAVSKIDLSNGSTYTANNHLNFQAIKTIPIATAETLSAVLAAYTAGTTVAFSGDSGAPLNYNNTYIGGAHGANIVHSVVMTAHGKTTADIGSTWSGTGHTFTIVRIVDENTLWVISENTGTHDKWAFYLTTLAGVTLTHVAGATNTSDIVVASDGLTQLLSPYSRRSTAVVVNGAPIDKTISAAYTSVTSLVIKEIYSLNNPADTLSYMQANVGTNPVPWSDDIFADVDVINTFTFSSNGAVAIDHNLTWNSAVTMGYVGATQEPALPFSGKTLSQYMNGVTAIGGVDYSVPVDISGVIVAWSALQANWADVDNPPNRMAQIVSLTGVNEFGFAIGYSPLRGITTRRLRKTYTTDAGGQLSASTKKQYIKAAAGSGSNPTIGQSYTVSAFRHAYSCSQVPDATVATWFIDGDAVIVILDFHKISALSSIAMPTFLDGRSIEIVSSSNVTLLSSVVNNKIDVSCSTTKGNIVLAIR